MREVCVDNVLIFDKKLIVFDLNAIILLTMIVSYGVDSRLIS